MTIADKLTVTHFLHKGIHLLKVYNCHSIHLTVNYPFHLIPSFVLTSRFSIMNCETSPASTFGLSSKYLPKQSSKYFLLSGAFTLLRVYMMFPSLTSRQSISFVFMISTSSSVSTFFCCRRSFSSFESTFISLSTFIHAFTLFTRSSLVAIPYLSKNAFRWVRCQYPVSKGGMRSMRPQPYSTSSSSGIESVKFRKRQPHPFASVVFRNVSSSKSPPHFSLYNKPTAWNSMMFTTSSGKFDIIGWLSTQLSFNFNFQWKPALARSQLARLLDHMLVNLPIEQVDPLVEARHHSVVVGVVCREILHEQPRFHLDVLIKVLLIDDVIINVHPVTQILPALLDPPRARLVMRLHMFNDRDDVGVYLIHHIEIVNLELVEVFVYGVLLGVRQLLNIFD